MFSTNVIRRIGVAALAATVAAVAAPAAVSPARAGSDRLRLSFEEDGPIGAKLFSGDVVRDVSGSANHGAVVTSYGGAVTLAAGGAGTVADFPAKCSTEPCPNAMVKIPDHASLDPGTADFEWGARLLLRSNETADGENVVQKGTWGQAGGQWKLQVDKSAGIPSCVVSGTVPGTSTDLRVVVRSSVGVADGSWHKVTCRRTAGSGVKILVDGAVTGSAAMKVVTLNSDAPVSVGAKSVRPYDNDQFHGQLDDVFMSLL